MKIVYALLFSCYFWALPDNRNYEITMEELLDQASFQKNWKNASINFQELHTQYPNEWLPAYYSSYYRVLHVFELQDTKTTDAELDIAFHYIQIADSLHPKNSEIACIQSMIASARLTVDPASRGQHYGQLARQFMEEAMRYNAQNPRAYYLSALALLYTPEAYGGGCQKATELALYAEELFEQFEPASNVHPQWGYQENLDVINGCRK